ncbi:MULTISPECIES: hypothetical protein [Micrococcaceae]|uniref:hypothetical protein n=1 Tax=Micrococcaceae TaxID=1268 RepID=UPI000BB9874E|nr:hypothetical protein [Glutamicibacter sp. BW78]PCC25456.1 hypothetical protein CIK75_07155 [Glutamicibacter sp. BW78]
MRIGDLSREHRHLGVVFLDETMAINGTLEYFRAIWVGNEYRQVLTISGWVSPPLSLDAEIEVQEPHTGPLAASVEITS